jgi:hypothetical protein
MCPLYATTTMVRDEAIKQLQVNVCLIITHIGSSTLIVTVGFSRYYYGRYDHIAILEPTQRR